MEPEDGGQKTQKTEADEPMPGLTEYLAVSSASLNFSDIPQAAAEVAQEALLDCVGCMIAGARNDAVNRLRALLLVGHVAPSIPTSLPFNRLPATDIALLYGTAAHTLDYDDIGIAMLGHPSAVLVPTLFSLATVRQPTGKELITAYVAGFEVAAILGSMVNPEHYAAGWHTTSSLGCVAAAVSAARLLFLNAEGTATAMGIAASHASGLRANFGFDAKPLHAGMAARAGVFSALAAQAGITANPRVLEAPSGYLQSVCNVRPSQLIPKGFGSNAGFELLKSGLSIKLHACCGTAHTTVDGVLRLMDRNKISSELINEIICEVNSLAPGILIHHQATTPAEARFCLEYCVAVTVLDGACGLRQFTEERVLSEDTQNMMQRVTVLAKPELSLERGGLTPSRVTIRLSNGEAFSVETAIAKGSPEAPASRDLIKEKFFECVADTFSEDSAKDLYAMLSGIADISETNALIELVGRATLNS